MISDDGQLINIMFAQRSQEKTSPLRKQLQIIADLANYQPVPSIPAPSQGFNYTLSQQRYSEFETPRPIKKQKNWSWSKVEEDKKLTTILQTQNFNHLFPRIKNPVHKQSPYRRKKVPTHFHKQRQETEVTRERSFTHDTPSSNEYDRFLSLESSQRDNEQLLSLSRKDPIKSQRIVDQVHKKVLMEASHYEEEESQNEDEFQKDAVPGPGAYSYSYSDFDKKSAKSTKASFLSQSSRFPQILAKMQNPPQVSVDENLVEKEKRRDEKIKMIKNRKLLVPFNSKSPRNFQSDSVSKIKSPGPQDYSPRFGIEQELIKKIQRNFKGNFGSNQQRFKEQKNDSLHLGPGSYEVPPLSSSIDGQNFYFKSRLERFGGL